MTPRTQWTGHSVGFWFTPLIHDVRWRLACYIVLAFTLLPVVLYGMGLLDYLINGGGR